MKTVNKSLLSKLAILLATLIWGTSFVIIKDTLDVIKPNFLMALRFTIASVFLSAIFWKRIRKATRKMLWQGAVIGVFLFLAYYWQTVGILYTTPGKNAFLTAVYCVIVPFLAWGCRGARPDKYNIIAALLCMCGIGIVSLDGSLTMGKGDFYTLIGGFFFACHMVAVFKFVKQNDPIVMTVLQFVAAAVCFWITTLLAEGVPEKLSMGAILPVLYLCVFCTAGAMFLQNFGQKYTDPSVAALLLSLEAVFGSLFSVIMGREVVTFRIVGGFLVIFISIVISETKLAFFKKKEKTEVR